MASKWVCTAATAAVGGLFVCGAASAELIAYEGFGEYAAGDLAGQSGGEAFAGSWVNSSSGGDANRQQALLAAETGLQYTDSKGNVLVTTAGAANNPAGKRSDIYHHTLDLTPPDAAFAWGETFWISGLFQRSASQNNWRIVLTDANLSVGVGFGMDNTTSDVRAVLQDSNTAGSVTVANGEVTFVVARVSLPATSGNFTVDVWVNPDLDEDLSAVAVGGADASRTRGFFGVTNVDRLAIYSHQNNAIVFDEIRVGTTHDAVMPIPEPASLALLAMGGAMLGGRRRR